MMPAIRARTSRNVQALRAATTVRSGTVAVDADLEDQHGRRDQRGERQQREPDPAQLGQRRGDRAGSARPSRGAARPGRRRRTAGSGRRWPGRRRRRGARPGCRRCPRAACASTPAPSQPAAGSRRPEAVSSRVSSARQSRSPTGNATATHCSVPCDRSASRRCGPITKVQASSATPEVRVSASSSAAAVAAAAGTQPDEPAEHQREQRVVGEHDAGADHVQVADQRDRAGRRDRRRCRRRRARPRRPAAATARAGSGRAGARRRPTASTAEAPASRRTGCCQAGTSDEADAEQRPSRRRRGRPPAWSASCSSAR